MAFMNFGVARGLSVVNNWEADMNREARHYQVLKQQKVEQQQEAAYIAGMLKQAPPQNDFDRKQYEKFAEGIMGEIVDITSRNPNWKYDVKSITQINTLSSKLLNNEYISRDKKYQEAVKNFIKYHDDNPTDKLNYSEEYKKEYERLMNYSKSGNADSPDEILGPDGSPMVKEYDFMHPVQINVLDEQLKLEKLKDSYATVYSENKDGNMYEVTKYTPEAKMSAAASLYQNNKGGWDRVFNSLTPEFKALYHNNPIEYLYKEKVEETFKDVEKAKYRTAGMKGTGSGGSGSGSGKGANGDSNDYFNLWVAPNLGQRQVNNPSHSAFLNTTEATLSGSIKAPLYDTKGQIIGVDGKTTANLNGKQVYIVSQENDMNPINGNQYMSCDIFIPVMEGVDHNEVLARQLNGGKKVEKTKWYGGKDEYLAQSTSQSPILGTSAPVPRSLKPIMGYKIKGVKLKLDISERNQAKYNQLEGGQTFKNKFRKGDSTGTQTFTIPGDGVYTIAEEDIEEFKLAKGIE